MRVVLKQAYRQLMVCKLGSELVFGIDFDPETHPDCEVLFCVDPTVASYVSLQFGDTTLEAFFENSNPADPLSGQWQIILEDIGCEYAGIRRDEDRSYNPTRERREQVIIELWLQFNVVGDDQPGFESVNISHLHYHMQNVIRGGLRDASLPPVGRLDNPPGEGEAKEVVLEILDSQI